MMIWLRATPLRVISSRDFFVHGQAHGFVHVALGFIELDPVDDLGLRRQFRRHLFLGTTQQEGFDPTVQVLQSHITGAFFQWVRGNRG